MTQPTTPRGLALRLLPALFGAFALLATWETARALYAPHAVAADADWESAAAEVRAGFRDGDLIVFAPYWSDQVGRQHLGDLVTPAMAGRADADRYGRVWEVSIRGARAPESEGARRVSEVAHGKVRVALYEKAPAIAVVFDFTAHLEEARVTQQPSAPDGRPAGGPDGEGRGDETPCYAGGGGFQCASTRVERRTLEIDYRPRRGILAPVDGALTTRLAFPPAPLGRTLVGYTGLSDYYSRKNGDGPVDFAVYIDGERVAGIRHHNADGWRRFSVDTARFSGPHAVSFEVNAPSAAWRTFGFHVEARP